MTHLLEPQYAHVTPPPQKQREHPRFWRILGKGFLLLQRIPTTFDAFSHPVYTEQDFSFTKRKSAKRVFARYRRMLPLLGGGGGQKDADISTLPSTSHITPCLPSPTGTLATQYAFRTARAASPAHVYFLSHVTDTSFLLLYFLILIDLISFYT